MPKLTASVLSAVIATLRLSGSDKRSALLDRLQGAFGFKGDSIPPRLSYPGGFQGGSAKLGFGEAMTFADGVKVAIAASTSRPEKRECKHRVFFICPLCLHLIPTGRFEQHAVTHIDYMGLFQGGTLFSRPRPLGKTACVRAKGGEWNKETHRYDWPGTAPKPLFRFVTGNAATRDAIATHYRETERVCTLRERTGRDCELDHCSCGTHDVHEQMHSCPTEEEREVESALQQHVEEAERAAGWDATP